MCIQSANVVAIHFQGKNFLSPPLDSFASHPGGQHTKKAVHLSSKKESGRIVQTFIIISDMFSFRFWFTR